MSTEWIYKYGVDTIVVKNSNPIELLVNGEVQDKKDGLRLSADLSGRLKTGEEIKASLGGTWGIKCSLFVDNQLQTPVSEK